MRNEGLEQLNEKEYMVRAIEISNNRIARINKQRIVYSRLSGIYKPFGVNFVCHFRIFKDPVGLHAVLLDHNNIVLLDHLESVLLG